MLDVLVVGIMWFDSLVEILIGSGGLPQLFIIRVLRVCRITRVMRIVRVFRSFRELRMILGSVVMSFKPLFWALIVMCLMMYMFGVALTEGYRDYVRQLHNIDAPPISQKLLDPFFGSLYRSCLTLYQSMAGGLSWIEIVNAMEPMPYINTIVFLSFTAIATFAVANIIAGIFVETAIEVAQQDRDTIIQDAIEERLNYVNNMESLFGELDIDNTGTVSKKELEMVSCDERMAAYLAAMDLDFRHVHNVFDLLDRDMTGEIDVDEFLTGCFRLKGDATGLEMAQIQLKCEWIMHQMTIMSTILSTVPNQIVAGITALNDSACSHLRSGACSTHVL